MGNTVFVAKQNAIETQIDMRLSSKELYAMSKRCLEEEKRQAKLALVAMEADKPAMARIHAENSVRNKHLAERYLRVASRTEAMAEAHTFLRKSAHVMAK